MIQVVAAPAGVELVNTATGAMTGKNVVVIVVVSVANADTVGSNCDVDNIADNDTSDSDDVCDNTEFRVDWFVGVLPSNADVVVTAPEALVDIVAPPVFVACVVEIVDTVVGNVVLRVVVVVVVVVDLVVVLVGRGVGTGVGQLEVSWQSHSPVSHSFWVVLTHVPTKSHSDGARGNCIVPAICVLWKFTLFSDDNSCISDGILPLSGVCDKSKDVNAVNVPM
jgi:hypothetical protein